METSVRVGRNEPCPCGSGKKYKACCERRVEVVAETRRSSGMLIGVTVVGLALAGVIALRYLSPDEVVTGTTSATTPVAPPVTTIQNPVGSRAAQPPGPVPAGKVWSAEHGHWHDAPGAASPNAPMPITFDANGTPTPASQPIAGGTPQPAGPAPAGKVWSAEHGHWHDAPGAATPGAPVPITLDANGTPSPAPAPSTPGTPAPPGPAPDGKAWSAEHGHWHDAAPGGTTPHQ